MSQSPAGAFQVAEVPGPLPFPNNSLDTPRDPRIAASVQGSSALALTRGAAWFFTEYAVLYTAGCSALALASAE